MQFIEQRLRRVERQQLADATARGNMVLECTKTRQQRSHIRTTTQGAVEKPKHPRAIHRRVELLQVQLYKWDDADVDLRI